MSKTSRGPTQQPIGPGLVHVALASWLICFFASHPLQGGNMSQVPRIGW